MVLASHSIMGSRNVLRTVLLNALVLATVVTSQMTAYYDYDQQLRRELLVNRKLDLLARPGQRQNKSSSTTLVAISPDIKNIQQLDTRLNTLKVKIWLRLEWLNPDLAWNFTEYGNIKFIRVNTNNIWKPRVTLLNSLIVADHITFNRNPAVISYKGGVTVIVPFTSVTYCVADVYNFPFDQHKCTLVFGSWTEDGTDIDISSQADYIPHSVSQISHDFELTAIEMRRVTHRHTCCRELYTAKIIELHLKRISPFYQIGVLLPAALLCLLTSGVFWVNLPKSQRLSLISVLLLANLLLLIYLSLILPASSDGTPRIIIFTVHSLVFCALAFILSAGAINLSCQRPSISPPNCVRGLTRGWIGKLLPAPVDDLDRFNSNAAWLPLVAFIDRICFLIYCISFFIIFILYLQ